MSFIQSPIFAESWNVAWRMSESGTILHDKTTPFNIIENPLRYWAADPFVIEREGKTYIFAELYDYIRCRGILGYCELIPGKKCRWTPILVEPFHLSYPCIIEHAGKMYLMPESGEDRSLILYEATDFPRKWKRVHTLRENIALADTTPVFGDLCLTHHVDNPLNPELLLIHLGKIDNDTVVFEADPLCSRPGGLPFEQNGKRFRPVQHSENFLEGYGKSLCFFQISLTDGSYLEIPGPEVFPADLQFSRSVYLDGMHTYNSSTHFEVIDIKTRRFNLLNLLFRFWSKLVQIFRRA